MNVNTVNTVALTNTSFVKITERVEGREGKITKFFSSNPLFVPVEVGAGPVG